MTVDNEANSNGERLPIATDGAPTDSPATSDGVTLSEEERRRFLALVQWSYAEDFFLAEPSLDQDSATLVLRGEVDAFALPEVRSLIDLIVDARPTRLRIDLADAAFVSVSAMLCMVDAARHIPEVVIDRPSPTVRRIFELVDADRRLVVGEG